MEHGTGGKQMIRAGIIGGAGYTGGELIRLLLRHPGSEISYVQSKSNAGNPLHKVHGDLLGDTHLIFTAEHHNEVDVMFLCAGHGEARKFLQANEVASSVRIIDLSNDFRLTDSSTMGDRKFVYGLPELNREFIRDAKYVANPGCFATAIQLGLLPLAKAGVLGDVHTTGITGSTGAGQSLSATSHFSWRANNVQAYKTLTHQHLGEIGESIRQLQPQKDIELNFIPWRGDFTRGIFISSLISTELSEEEIYILFKDHYQSHPYTHVSKDSIFLKQVVNTNKCIVQTEKVGSKLVIHSVIDNLLKGASGQAVQNMNLMFGMDECAGLELKASYF
jgi:N-acetyl-gamma-glutamyl-phosphate reductase